MKRILAIVLTLVAAATASVNLVAPPDGSLFLPQGGPMSVWFSWTGGHPQEVCVLVIWDNDGPVYVGLSHPPYMMLVKSQWVTITAFGEGYYHWAVWAGVEQSAVWDFEIRGNCPPCQMETSTWGRIKFEIGEQW